MSVRRLAEVQPATFAFTPENLAWAEKEIAKYPPGRQASAIISLLWRAQEQNDRWLPKPAIEEVADMLAMPYIRALEVATFYTMFNLEPVGRHHVQVCGTTPCALRGAEQIKKVLPQPHRRRRERQRRRRAIVGRGRMPGRLLQRAGGADQRRLLRGPDSGEFRQAGRRSRRRPAGQDGFADRARMSSEPAGGPLTALTTLYGVDGKSGPASAEGVKTGKPAMLDDKDRIFTNLYGLGDRGLEGRAGARRLGRHQGDHRQRAATGSSPR